MDKPNILVLCSDQHKPDMLGFLESTQVRTPNLDALQEQGTYFSQAYCTSPICTPSRMSFITGKYPHQIYVPNNGFPLDPAEMTWPRKLRELGYRSTMLGKMDFCGEYQDGGFSDYQIIRRRPTHKDLVDGKLPYLTKPHPTKLPHSVRSWGTVKEHVESASPRTDRVIEEAAQYGERDYFIGNYDHDKMVTKWAVDYLRKQGQRRNEQPWALYVGLVYPHAPFTVPAEYFNMYYPDLVDVPLDYRTPNPDLHPAMQHLQRALGVDVPSEEGLRRTLAAYYGMVTCMDDMIGEILRELHQQGLSQNTYVIYTSDHGEALGEHGLFFKKSPYDASVRVPLLLAGPGIPKGQRIDHPVSLVDMYPTVMDMAGLPTDNSYPGSSWLSLANGDKESYSLDYALSEYHGHLNLYDWLMLVRSGYKYVWYDGQRPSLYHLESDPHEMIDLALDPGARDTVQELDSFLHTIVNPDHVCQVAKWQQGLLSKQPAEGECVR